MEKIKKVRVAFCRYLQAIAKEKKITIDEIVQKTNRSYSDIKKILDGLISPSFDDLVVIADLLNIHITLNPEISLAHKKISNEILFSADGSVTSSSEEQ
ncbi:MAG: helix-turn-helix transcriptional regulator [Puia sp.]|nr:helix-turn-helix transcriptional regulator [Puia sp.]